MFHTLWRPAGEGVLGRLLSTTVWAGVRRLGEGPRSLAGPLILLSTIVLWAALLVVGFALVYVAHLPDGFSYGSTLDPTARAGLVDALYVSTVVLATLGLGDIVPVDAWLRLVVPLQALLGFALLTAGVSWVLQIQPALGRRRSLARHVTALRGGQEDAGTSLTPTEVGGIAAQLSRIHVDLRQSSTTFYFAERETAEALPRVLPYVRSIALHAAADDDAALRLAGATLDRVVVGLAELLATRFVSTDDDADTDEVLRRFAEDHGHPPDVAAVGRH